jgi:alkylation response protein AidB-like acyl-CoA dehydrogenase
VSETTPNSLVGMIDSQKRLAAIRGAARDFLKREWSLTRLRELVENDVYPFDLWPKMATLGWPTILMSDEFQGSNGTATEFCGITEELGKALAPTPVTGTVLAASCIQMSPRAETRDLYLPLVAKRQCAMALAVRSPDLTANPFATGVRAEGLRGSRRLTGSSFFVPYANLADYLVVFAQGSDGSYGLYIVKTSDVAIKRISLHTLDWFPASQVVFDGVAVQDANILGEGGVATEMLDHTLQLSDLACATELVGVASAGLDIAIDYAKERIAFGRPIGAFQAIKHKLVDAYTDIQIGRALCYGAADYFPGDRRQREVRVAMAAFWAQAVLRSVPERALQVFGGIGFTWEHDIHLFLRRAATLTSLFGERSLYRNRVIQSL